MVVSAYLDFEVKAQNQLIRLSAFFFLTPRFCAFFGKTVTLFPKPYGELLVDDPFSCRRFLRVETLENDIAAFRDKLCGWQTRFFIFLRNKNRLNEVKI